MKIDELRANPLNPRTITKDKLSALKKAMDKFGDLGGIVFNVKSKQLVGGHQRTTLLDNAIIEIVQKYKKATKTGTVAEGYIETNKGERFSYREVSWDDQTEKAANIAANKNAGEFDLASLSKIMSEISPINLEFTMFDFDELSLLLPGSTTVSEHDRSLKLGLLSETFLFPPFSVLNARSGSWQDRKRAWLALGIQSELKRGGGN